MYGWSCMMIKVTRVCRPTMVHYTGNDTMANVTVQVLSSVVFDPSTPTTVVAGTNFQLTGVVQDSVNSSRPFSGPVRVDAFWLDEPDELLASGFTTAVWNPSTSV